LVLLGGAFAFYRSGFALEQKEIARFDQDHRAVDVHIVFGG